MQHTPRAMLAAALGEAEHEYRAAQLALKLQSAGADQRIELAFERLRLLHRAAAQRGEAATGEIVLPDEVLALR